MNAPRSRGAALIGLERQHQLDETPHGPNHDEEHIGGELLDAAIAYVIEGHPDKERVDPNGANAMLFWPWGPGEFRPAGSGDLVADRVRDLQKAGALIAAEIDRTLREERLREQAGDQGTLFEGSKG